MLMNQIQELNEYAKKVEEYKSKILSEINVVADSGKFNYSIVIELPEKFAKKVKDHFSENGFNVSSYGDKSWYDTVNFDWKNSSNNSFAARIALFTKNKIECAELKNKVINRIKEEASNGSRYVELSLTDDLASYLVNEGFSVTKKGDFYGISW